MHNLILCYYIFCTGGSGTAGGLYAEAGTPHGQSARAGLGGGVSENGGAAGTNMLYYKISLKIISNRKYRTCFNLDLKKFAKYIFFFTF